MKSALNFGILNSKAVVGTFFIFAKISDSTKFQMVRSKGKRKNMARSRGKRKSKNKSLNKVFAQRVYMFVVIEQYRIERNKEIN